MKKTWLVAVAILGRTGVLPLHAANAQEKITVYIQNDPSIPPVVDAVAKGMAGEIFARIGVRVHWTGQKPPANSASRVIEIGYVTNTPVWRIPGAMAYALPYEGVHIEVFYDRVRAKWPDNPAPLLAHVLVHEITHILQGVCRHSPDGIMKARWSSDEIHGMRVKPLPFTAEDVELVRLSLAHAATATLPGRILHNLPPNTPDALGR